MITSDETAVSLARWKIAGFIALLCLLFVSDVLTFNKDSIVSLTSLKVVRDVLVGVVFFSLAVWLTNKLFDPVPALGLTRDGIAINPLLGPRQFIPWSDIAGLEAYKTLGPNLLVTRKFVQVNLLNPEKYRRPKTGRILIQSNMLNIGFDELMGLCQAYFGRYGKRSPT